MGLDPDDNAAARVIARRLSAQKQQWFDNLALRGAHEYAVELERKIERLQRENTRLKRERDKAKRQSVGMKKTT